MKLPAVCLGLLLALMANTKLCAAASKVCSPGLSTKYYARRCPRFESIVKTVVKNDSRYEAQMPAHLLRLLWHDCTVEGCDASVMLKSVGDVKSEREAEDNLLFGLMKGGYDTINTIKRRLERECPRVVSCADIIAAAAKQALKVAGGPDVAMRYGRRDGLVSLKEAPEIVLPHERYSPARVRQVFQRLGFSVADQVALIGTHTLGTANCWKFYSRIKGTFDKRLNPAYARYLNKTCIPPSPGSAGNWAWLHLDNVTATKFDNQYFKNLLNGYGLLNTDAGLLQTKETKSYVEKFAKKQSAFFSQYKKSLLKLSESGVLLSPKARNRRPSAFAKLQGKMRCSGMSGGKKMGQVTKIKAHRFFDEKTELQPYLEGECCSFLLVMRCRQCWEKAPC